MIRFAAIALLMLSAPAYAADALKAEDVLVSSIRHYPDILKSAQEIDAASGKIQNAEGAFDASVDQKLSSRPNGFYDGKQADTRLVKPLPFLNSRVYGGYRVSDGKFPIYDDKLITNSSGEYMFGMQLSLLRDSMIDEKRLKLYNNRVDRDIADIDLLLTQVAVQHDALYHYWHWVSAGHTRSVYKSLLDIAQKRQQALKQRVKRGDVAEIYLTENQQYLLKRQGQLNDAEREFDIRTNKLSLFLRDNDGSPQPVDHKRLPSAFPKHLAVYNKDTLLAALKKRPELAKIRQQITAHQNEQRQGENMQLPKADVNVEMSDDGGNGSASRAPFETSVMLNVSIPLQTNLGKGREQEARAKIRKLEYEQQFLLEKLNVELDNALTTLDTARRYVQLTAQEIEMAQKMRSAEVTRFENGDSDFFVLNMREERLSEAQIKHIEANEKFQVALAHLYALTLNYEKLLIKPPVLSSNAG